MAPYNFRRVSRPDYLRKVEEIGASPSLNVIEDALSVMMEGAATLQSVGTHWIAHNPETFLRICPDIALFICKHQANPTMSHVLEQPKIVAAIRSADLVDAFRRVIPRHAPASAGWFKQLHRCVAIKDLDAAHEVFLAWIAERISQGSSSVEAFFGEHWSGTTRTDQSNREVTRHLSKGSVWRKVSPGCFREAIEMIIQAGYLDLVYRHRQKIRLRLAVDPNSLKAVENALARSRRQR